MKKLIKHIFDNNSIGLAAQTAFYLLIAVVPLSLFATKLLSKTNWATGIIPESFINLLQESSPPNISSPILFIISAWGASSATWALMRGISTAYTGKPLFSIKARIVAVAVTIGFIGVIAISLTLVAFGKWLTFVASAISIFILLFVLYIKTPNTTANVKISTITAVCATFGWLAVTKGFELYLSYFSNFSAVYGSFGAFIGVAFWSFCISIVVILGAEIGSFFAK